MLVNLSPELKQQVENGIAIMREGGIVAFPTDTVYGLGASVFNEMAVQRIYQVKRRPSSMALPLLLARIDQINEVAEKVSDIALCLAQRFWPGDLTLVLPKSKAVPDFVTAGGKTVAVRVPAHPVPVALIEGLGTPIIGTSANLSGKPSPVTAAEVYAQLGDKVDLIIDGGRCPGGKESTIVDVTGDVPRILREGAIARDKIKRVCAVV